MASHPSTRSVFMSVEEYLALPEEKPYLEYIDGEVVPKPMGNYDHGVIAAIVTAALVAFFREHGGAAGTEVRSRFQVGARMRFLLPDVSYWAPGKPRHGEVSALPPTLAIEIRSPDQTLASQRRKCQMMRDGGADVCWFIDPATQTVEVFENGGTRTLQGDIELTSAHLPGFQLPLAELFATLD